MQTATWSSRYDFAPLQTHLASLVSQDSAFTQLVTQVERDNVVEDVASTCAKKESVTTTAKRAGRICLATTIVYVKNQPVRKRDDVEKQSESEEVDYRETCNLEPAITRTSY